MIKTIVPAAVEDSFRVRMFKLSFKENADEPDTTLRFARALMTTMDTTLHLDTEAKRRSVLYWHRTFQKKGRA